MLWPVVGFVGAVVGGWLQLKWLAPLGLGGTFLSLLARWAHLDKKVCSQLNEKFIVSKWRNPFGG